MKALHAYIKRFMLVLLLGVLGLPVTYADISLQAKVLLHGAYDASSGLMRDSLYRQHYLPTTQPYSVPPFNYAGTETLPSDLSKLTDTEAIVDWVLVELRDPVDTSLISAQKAVLLQRNGQLLDPITLQTSINFSDFPSGRYRIGIRHRNHLGIISRPITLSGIPTSIDFTNPNTPVEGTEPFVLENGQAFLWAGDANTTSSIIGQGNNNERSAILEKILQEPNNTTRAANFIKAGYAETDLNLDGVTNYTGPNNDSNLIDAGILSHPFNVWSNSNFMITSSLPKGTFDHLGHALRVGDLGPLTANELQTDFNNTVTQIQHQSQQILQDIFRLSDNGSLTDTSITEITWNPSHDSIWLDSLNLGNNIILLKSNNAAKQPSSIQKPLAIAGIKPNGARYVVMGGNPLHDLTHTTQPGGSGNSQLQNFLLSTLNWLTKRTDLTTANFKVVIAHQSDSYWFKHDGTTHQWLSQQYPNATINTPDRCESALLANCLVGADLLVIGRDEGNEDNHKVPFDLAAIMETINQAQRQGIPILYLHYDGGSNSLSTALMRYFGLTATDNYWRQEQLNAFEPSSLYTQLPATVSAIQTTLTTLADSSIAFNYNDTNCTDYVGTVTCNPDQVTETSTGLTLQTLFNHGTTELRTLLKGLDEDGTNVFKLDNGYRLIKLATLMADAYRATIQYPMDKKSTPDQAFLRALYADNVIHYMRPNNPAQPSMGDFTAKQSQLHTAITSNQTLSLMPSSYSEWTSTGLYAPPGKAITIKRTDTSATTVKIKFNFQRSGTSRIWNTQQYTRPHYMTSTEITLEIGKTYTLSSPYGGPIYIGWNATSGVTPPIQLALENVLKNPLLQAFDTNSIQQFVNEVNTTLSDWVDIKTPYAEIHSLKSHLFKAFAKQDGNSANGYTITDVQNYIQDLNRYLIAGNYEYAGFNGAGLAELNNEVTDFCTEFGLTQVNYNGAITNLCTSPTIHTKPKIQHINSDINAACGALCSGNPFDSYAPIMPLDWGENHEMGHNLQRARLKIYEGRSGEVSNNIFPLHTLWVDAQVKQKTAAASNRPNSQQAYALLQTAISQNTVASINHPLWSGAGVYDYAFERLAFYIQLMYTQQSWDFYTKAYVMERILNDAVKTEASWLAVKDLLKLGNYSRTDASNLTGNDFMYLAASNIARKNYSDYFAAWGIALSQAAQDQINANGYTEPVSRLFYYTDGSLPVAMPSLADTLLLDGSATWHDPTP